MEWQPIETAPKDNFESILLFTKLGIIEGFWNSRGKCWDQMTISCDGYGETFFNEKPSHWAPLPKPPM